MVALRFNLLAYGSDEVLVSTHDVIAVMAFFVADVKVDVPMML